MRRMSLAPPGKGETGDVSKRERLSALDSIFLPMETENQPLHVGSVLILEGPSPSPDAFRHYVAAQLATMPFHRRRLMRMPLDLGRPIWVDAQVDLLDHVHHGVLPPPGDEAQLCAMVAQVMHPPLDRSRPLWQLWQVDGLAGGRWAVLAKAHHALVDGRSGTDVVGALLTASSHWQERPVVSHAAAGSRPPPSRLALVADLVCWLGRLPVRAVRFAVRSVLAPRKTGRQVARLRLGLAQVLRPDLPPSVLNGPLGSDRTWRWTGGSLTDVVHLAHAADCTVNDVYLAVLAGGYRRFLLGRGEPLQGMALRAIVPVSRRRRGQPWRPGNLASAVFVELPVHLADARDRLSAVRSRTRQQKADRVAEATEAVVRMADHLPAALLLQGARAYGRAGQGRVNVVASNVPGPSEVRYFAGRRVLEIAPWLPTAQEVRTTTAMMSYAGRFTIGITGDARALPDLERLVAEVAREVAELVAPDAIASPTGQSGSAGCASEAAHRRRTFFWILPVDVLGRSVKKIRRGTL